MFFSIGNAALQVAKQHINLRIKSTPESPMALQVKYNGGKLPCVVADKIKILGSYVGETEKETVEITYGLDLRTGETGAKLNKNTATFTEGESYYYTNTGSTIKGKDLVPNLAKPDGSRLTFKELFEGLIEKFYIEDTPRLFQQLVNEFIERGGPPTGL